MRALIVRQGWWVVLWLLGAVVCGVALCFGSRPRF